MGPGAGPQVRLTMVAPPMAELQLPERIKRLEAEIAGRPVGSLLHESTYRFIYAADDPGQPAVSLLLPPAQLIHDDGELFPSMDMNLPEGFLFQQIIELFRKQRVTKMHLLALMGRNAIGRVGFSLPGRPLPPAAPTLERARLLAADPQQQLFGELVQAYLAGGVGISGVQPKIMVPTRATLPIPDLIVKTAGAGWPGLAANEYLCLSAARRAGIEVPRFELSDDAGLLLVDRFDIAPDGTRLGFEDAAALMGLRVSDKLSNRKYHGSYEKLAELIGLMSSQPAGDLARFYEQLALSVLVRNGDAHLKNYAMVYTSDHDVRLSPMYDVVTTSIYTHERPGGFEDTDRTLALKWRAGKRGSRAYPGTDELLAFGRELCGVSRPEAVIQRIADAMAHTLADARQDARIPATLLAAMAEQWALGMAHAGR